jgi:Putative peptidoglycan binding domain
MDEVDWFEEPGQPSSEPTSASRVGLIPGGGRGGGDQPPTAETEQAALIRRRRIAALVALGVLFVLALVIPLVVFGGDGGSTAEQTTPLTTAPTTTAAQTTTQQTTTTTTTTTGRTPLKVTLPGGESLRPGDRGTEVENLQKGLAALGFAAGEPDGIYGSTTEAAVVDFQESNDLTPDGIAGEDTVTLLNSALADEGVTVTE